MWKQGRKLLGAATVVAAAAAMLAPAAEATTPAKGYGQFAGCPSPAENAETEICIRSVVKGGHVKLGTKDVPIANPITLSGGTNSNLENFTFNSKGGLPPVKEKVPGGVIGLTGLTWLAEFLGSEALTLYAATELAGTPTLGLHDLTLPIKVHLINPVLGSRCYVGSASSPIVLHLTDGTTSPPPPANGSYVDNAFAAPGANGCTLTLLGFIPVSINGLVNSQSGLPSAAGRNEAVQNINTELVASQLAYP